MNCGQSCINEDSSTVTNTPILCRVLIVLGAIHMRDMGYMGIALHSSQFCCEPKTTLENKAY